MVGGDGGTAEKRALREVASALLVQRGARVLDPTRDVRRVRAPARVLDVRDAFAHHTFVALAMPPGQVARDLYRLEMRVSPQGAAWDPRWIVNLTRTSAADEAELAVHGALVANACFYEGRLAAIELRDFRGENPEISGVSEWDWWQRQGDRITNLERTGQARGIALSHWTVDGDSDASISQLQLGPEALRVWAPGGVLLADVALPSGTGDGPLVLEKMPPERKMTMAFPNWFADRGRGFADQGLAPRWLGHAIELLKEVYFTAKVVEAQVAEAVDEVEEVVAPAPDVVAPAVVEAAVREARERALLQAERSDFPWPPPPVDPLLRDRLAGEGLWQPLVDDRINHEPHQPPLLYTTWVRASAHYRLKQKPAWLVTWDPRHIELHMRAGTREPIPQTAHRGDGRIPRDPDVLERLVGAFNGGFQTTHFPWGMMVDGRLLRAPKPWGATIARLDDGRPAFGTWPRGRRAVPDGVHAFRQNLVPIVEDGVFNPYHARKFGAHANVAGAIDGWTVRSALCHTRYGHLVYIYADFADHRALGQVALNAGCRYAVHLDMNWGHTGFELYRSLADGQPPRDPANLVELAGVRLEGAVLADRMRHMNAPTRYLGVDYRDFFYLVRRRVVPGADLDEARWRMDLPHNGDSPPRIAWARLRSRDAQGRLDVLQIDPTGVQTSLTGQGPFEPERLMATIPLAWPGAAGDEAVIDIVGTEIRGRPLSAAPPGPLTATVLGRDDHFVYLASATRVPTAEIRAVFEQRGVRDVVWVPTPATAEIRVYQPARGKDGRAALLELEPGRFGGEVVDRPTIREPRLVLHALARSPRVERLFEGSTSRPSVTNVNKKR